MVQLDSPILVLGMGSYVFIKPNVLGMELGQIPLGLHFWRIHCLSIVQQ